MKNIIIFSENNKFVSTVFNRKFLKKNDLNLNCVVAVKHELNLIKETFDKIDLFTHENFEKGNLSNINNLNTNQLDESILKKYSDIEILSNKFLDFYNPNGNKFSLRETRQAYYNSLLFVLNFLSKYRPNVVFFSNVPHSFTGIILALVCKKEKIQYIFKREISIPGRFIFQNDFFNNNFDDKTSKVDNYFKNIIDENNLFFNIYINKVLENDHKGIKKIFSSKRDHFLINNIDYVKKFNIFFFTILLVRQLMIYFSKAVLQFLRDFFLYFFVSNKKYKNRIFLEDFWKNSKELFSNSSTLKISREIELLKGDIRKFNLLKIYNSKCKNIVLNKKFIYFPLHYQPEATTYPFGNYFIDQINAIKLLSAHIPDDCEIYVKEHPDTFNIGRESWVIGDFSRDKNFYEELAAIKKVYLVGLNINTLELINKSFAISTIAGAVGLESIIQNKPVFLFGNPWYKNCEGVYEFTNHDTCKKSIKEVFVEKKIINKNNVNNFFTKSKYSVFDDNNLFSIENLQFIQERFLERIITR